MHYLGEKISVPLYDTLDESFSISFKDSDNRTFAALMKNHHRTCLIGNIHISEMDSNGERQVAIEFVPLPKEL